MTSQLKQLDEKAFHISFIDFTSKCIDWRYKTYQDLMRSGEQSKTIYWIGTLDLEEITEATKSVSVSFLELNVRGSNIGTQTDRYYDRYEDGASKGGTTLYDYSVSDPDFKAELIAAKNNGFNHFHMCLEETVYRYGAHEVSLLFNIQKEEKEKTVRGVASRRLLLEESLGFYAAFAFGYISEKTERLTLLTDENYRWHK